MVLPILNFCRLPNIRIRHHGVIKLLDFLRQLLVLERPMNLEIWSINYTKMELALSWTGYQLTFQKMNGRLPDLMEQRFMNMKIHG